MPVTGESLVRFGVFEVDLQSGELRKAGRRIALQDQPFRVLGFEPGAPMRVGVPQMLFEFNTREVGGFAGFPIRGYDMAPDGQHFYAIRGCRERRRLP